MAEIRLNFTIDTDEHPELAFLEAGIARRGGRSTEALRLLKLGAKADVALRAMEGNRLTQAVQTGLLTEAGPLHVHGAAFAQAQQTIPAAQPAPPAASTHAPVGTAYQMAEPSPLPAPVPQPVPQGATAVAGVGLAPSTGSTSTAAPRRDGKSKASAFMG